MCLRLITEADESHQGPVRSYTDRVDAWRQRSDREQHARLSALGYELPPLEEL